jgi:hypothetical protein
MEHGGEAGVRPEGATDLDLGPKDGALDSLRVLLVLLLAALASEACAGPDQSDGSAAPVLAADAAPADPDSSQGKSPRTPGPDASSSNGDGRTPDIPEGYPPPECIPPCMWEALVACRVPELLERSCIRELDSVSGSVLGICSMESMASQDPGVGYLLGGHACLAYEHFEFSGNSGVTFPLARRWRDASGEIIAEDFHYAGLGGGALVDESPVVYCGSRDSPDAVPYPYSYAISPPCEPWSAYHGDIGRFFISGFPYCASGTCSPVPAVDPLDAAVTDAAIGNDATLPSTDAEP